MEKNSKPKRGLSLFCALLFKAILNPGSFIRPITNHMFGQKQHMIEQNLSVRSSWSDNFFTYSLFYLYTWKRVYIGKTLIRQNGIWLDKNWFIDHRGLHLNFIINDPGINTKLLHCSEVPACQILKHSNISITTFMVCFSPCRER